MDGSCSTHGRYYECIQCFVGKPKGKNRSEGLDVNGRIIA